jgi:hypothetical protein
MHVCAKKLHNGHRTCMHMCACISVSVLRWSRAAANPPFAPTNRTIELTHCATADHPAGAPPPRRSLATCTWPSRRHRRHPRRKLLRRPHGLPSLAPAARPPTRAPDKAAAARCQLQRHRRCCALRRGPAQEQDDRAGPLLAQSAASPRPASIPDSPPRPRTRRRWERACCVEAELPRRCFAGCGNRLHPSRTKACPRKCPRKKSEKRGGCE